MLTRHPPAGARRSQGSGCKPNFNSYRGDLGGFIRIQAPYGRSRQPVVEVVGRSQ